MSRRRKVEVFGLSMLDTVTCSLGGGIVLMLIIASQIPPAARVSVFSNSTATGGTTATGILTIFFEFKNPTDPAPLMPRLCGERVGNSAGGSGGGLTTALVGGAAEGEVFRDPDDRLRRRFGYAVWWRGAPEELPDCIRVNLVNNGDDCLRVFTIASGERTEWPECSGNDGPPALEFHRLRGGRFRLDGVGP